MINVAVYVVRHYGGIKLGNRRFKILDFLTTSAVAIYQRKSQEKCQRAFRADSQSSIQSTLSAMSFQHTEDDSMGVPSELSEEDVEEFTQLVPKTQKLFKIVVLAGPTAHTLTVTNLHSQHLKTPRDIMYNTLLIFILFLYFYLVKIKIQKLCAAHYVCLNKQVYKLCHSTFNYLYITVTVKCVKFWMLEIKGLFNQLSYVNKNNVC